MADEYDPTHSHEPEIPPILDPEGRCLVCALLVERNNLLATLTYLVDVHHRTLTGSKLHDPENQEWTECPCKTCRRVKEVVDAS